MRTKIRSAFDPPVIVSLPPPRHGVAELLTLVGAVRRLAFDQTLPPSEALGRIRDAFGDYDRQGAEHSYQPGRP
jgi:hypothetical protein